MMVQTPASAQSPHRRWYDSYSNIRLLIDLSEDLPLAIQQNLGSTLIETIKRYQNLVAASADLRTLGADMVMGLFKSRRKLRWYDHIPELHKAFNMMAILPEPVLEHLNEQCSDLVHFILTHKQKRTTPIHVMGQMITKQLSNVPTNPDDLLPRSEPTGF